MKFSLSNNKTKNLLFLGFSFISSFLILMICSRSSFLYPMNDWVDAQCFFTVGKAMGNGQVVYRDIFEQKGILLYVLHMFAYFISHTTFIGVFFLEVIAGTAFLFINIKLINLYTDFRYAVLSASLCSLLIYASRAFCKGDSAEELCLPLLAYALYLSVKAFKTEKWLTSKQLFSVGIVSACVLWIKYTMLGFFIGWIVVPVAWLIKEKKFRALGQTFLFIGLGVVTVTLPILIYFAVNHSLSYLWEVYFYKNMISYSNTGENQVFSEKLRVIFGHIYAFTRVSLTDNYKRFTGILCLGFLGMLFIKGWKIKISIYLTFMTMIVFIFGGGNGFVYYSVPLSVFTVFGFISLYLFVRFLYRKIINKPLFFKKSGYTVLVAILTVIIGTAGAYVLSYNTEFMQTKQEDLVQYKFRKIIEKEKNPTLLNVGFLDSGFYTVCDIVPNCRYFCKLNSAYREVYDGQMNYIRQGRGMFIASIDMEIEDGKYEKVAEETVFYDEDQKDKVYRLYRRKSS